MAEKNLNLQNLDLSLLETLSPAEKELALSILKEYAEKGESSSLNDILLEDYAEPPVDILTFVDDYKYLGNAWHDAQGNSKLYPYWRKELVKIFPDNLTTSVNNAIFSGSRGRGKEQPISSLVLSDKGFIRMGDVTLDTKVFGCDGKLHPVTGIYPQGVKDVYEITFSDGTTARCGLEHLWKVVDMDHMELHKNAPKEEVLTTECLLNRSLLSGRNRKFRYKIPVCKPIKFERKDTFISPYLMGCLLGDGRFSGKHYISITSADNLIIDIFKNELLKNNYKLSPKKCKNNKCIDFDILPINRGDKNKYVDEIKKLNLLGTYSDTKFIPDVYLYNDVESRTALLQGLLDTDGGLHKSKQRNGQISYSLEFSTTSAKLRDDVIWLVQSLGGTATYIRRASQYKDKHDIIKKCLDHYRIKIRLPEEIIPFKLDRKLIPYKNTTHIQPYRYITRIEKLDKKEECQCIMVGSEEHLYITDNFIVTHNTEIAVLIAAYLLHRVLCLKDPVAHFHLKPTEKLVFAFMNIKLDLAKEIGIAKFQNTIQSSPWFLERGTLEGRTKKMWVPKKFNDQEAIDIKIGSQADDLIGLPIYFCFFDEVSFQKNKDVEKQKQKANDAIDTAIGGMKTRFVFKGKNPTLLCLASSKRSDKSFLEEHMRKKLKSEKDNVYISDGSVWEVKPKGTYSEETFRIGLGNKFLQSVVIPDEEPSEPYIAKGYKIIEAPIDFKADFIDDIDRALCDFAGISSSSITKYINGASVNQIITDRIKNPFSREILEIGDGPEDDTQYYNFFDINKIDPQLRSKPLFIHLDMSYTGDMTGIAGVFIRGKKHSLGELDQAKDLFYSLAFSVNIKAPKGRHISFEKNRNFIYWLKEKGFNIKGITSDTFQSYDTGEALRAKGYPYSVLSVDRVDTNRVCIPYQYLRSTIYEKRLEIYEDKLLISELIDLERNMDTGKIDHPDGGCFTGDTKVKLVDGRELSFFELIKEYEEGKINYVYSMNLQSHKIEPKPILKAWKTGENKSLIKLTFDNGECVECTPNHRFLLRNGVYIEAKDMLPGDSVMPLYTKYPTAGGLKNYRLYYEPFEDKWHFEHRQFAQKILDEKYLVHHIDCNPDNNNPNNLVWCSKELHIKIHQQMCTGANSPEALQKKSQSIKNWHQLNKGSKKYLQRAEKTRNTLLKDNFEKYGHNASVDYQKHIKDIEQTFNVKWDALTTSERLSLGVKLAQIKDPTIQDKTVENLKRSHALGKFENAKKALQECNDFNKQLKKLFPQIDEEKFVEFFGFEYSSLEPRKRAPWINRYRQKLYELKNHKVVSIEYLDKKADVYDIEVADNHNFALACGVFVHNCKDIADATCGAIYNASKHAEEFAYDYGEQLEDVLRINGDSKEDDVKQLTIDLKNELLEMGQKRLNRRVHPSDADQGTEDYNLYDDIIII